MKHYHLLLIPSDMIYLIYVGGIIKKIKTAGERLDDYEWIYYFL